MIATMILIAVLAISPEERIYGGSGLDKVRIVAQRLKTDFSDRELNRVFDPKDRTYESIGVKIEFDKVTVEFVRVGTWPPTVKPLVTVYRGHPDFERLRTLIRTPFSGASNDR